MKDKKKQLNNQLDITKLELWHDTILVRAIRPQPKGGKLVDPSQYEDKPEWGEIICVGSGVAHENAKVGKIVRFGKYSTEAVRSNGEDYFIVSTEDVTGNL